MNQKTTALLEEITQKDTEKIPPENSVQTNDIIDKQI